MCGLVILQCWSHASLWSQLESLLATNTQVPPPPPPSLSFLIILMCVLCSNLGYQLGTGGDLLLVTDLQTSDGLQQVFSTNLFGHFVMVYTHQHTHTHTHTHTHQRQLQELEGFLSAQPRECHVIWTSSRSASKLTFDPQDIQGKNRLFQH